MCGTCGCQSTTEVKIHSHDHHHHPDSAPHAHAHPHPVSEVLTEPKSLHLAQSILQKNDRLAQRNRTYFQSKGVLTLNLVSSPGSGKTAFLERTLADLHAHLNCAVVVGDLETDNDAQRLRQHDAPVVQITTGTLCHLEADMIFRATQDLDLDYQDLLIIENVGNLVCPAAYDLGEELRVVMLSVTEGEDKPLKYPTMFKSADLIIINKIDIAEVVGFDLDKALDHLHQMAPEAKIFQVSARTGAGMEAWYDFLREQLAQSQLPSREDQSFKNLVSS